MTSKKLEIGDMVFFDILGTEIIGEGKLLGKAMTGLVEFWIVEITKRNAYLETRPEKAIVMQECFLREWGEGK